MSHTYSNLLSHLVFSTHERVSYIAEPIRDELYAYLGGIVREQHGIALTIGGMPDHVHMLVKLPCDLAPADCLRVAKSNSSLWVHKKWQERSAFAWQVGYGAFSVSESVCPEVMAYIQRQEEHHRKMSFQEEFLLLLRKHNIAFDEKYLWR